LDLIPSYFRDVAIGLFIPILVPIFVRQIAANDGGHYVAGIRSQADRERQQSPCGPVPSRPSSASRGSRERQDLLGNAALLPKVQQKPLGSHAEQRNRFAMNGKKWATLCCVVTKLPTHILIATVCIPDSASFSSLIVDPYTRLDEVSRVRKKTPLTLAREGQKRMAGLSVQ